MVSSLLVIMLVAGTVSFVLDENKNFFFFRR